MDCVCSVWPPRFPGRFKAFPPDQPRPVMAVVGQQAIDDAIELFTEASSGAYLLGTRVGADTEVRFLGDLAAGDLVAEHVAPPDWLRIADLVAAYRDLPPGTVDTSVVAACERLGASALATLDRRHFSVVRPAHLPGFDLVP